MFLNLQSHGPVYMIIIIYQFWVVGLLKKKENWFFGWFVSLIFDL